MQGCSFDAPHGQIGRRMVPFFFNRPVHVKDVSMNTQMLATEVHILLNSNQ
jgi:hypothetical protein